jgi:predicted nucleic acid-binding protein
VKVVFDTVVVLRAYINPQNRWGRLLSHHANGYRLVVSPLIIAEHLDVLLRPEFIHRFTPRHGMLDPYVHSGRRAPNTQSSLGPAWQDGLDTDEDLAFLDAASST